YMAPEQIDGEPVDERSDQCSWCIAAWEAIYGEQPFIAGTLAIRSAAMKTDRPKPPAGTKVPRGIQRVLMRGMLPDAKQRWPSMRAVVGELERAMSSRRVVIASAAVAAVLVIATVFALGRSAGKTTPDCTIAGAPASDLWTPAMRDEIIRAFAATGAP